MPSTRAACRAAPSRSAGRARRLLRLSGLAALMTLSACVVEGGPSPYPPFPPPIPGPGPGGPPQACPMIYAPVCARRGRDLETFSNACMADAAGYRVISRGECGDFGRPDRPQVCTREYDPVCARRGRDLETFPNACEADAAGYRIIADGPCGRG